MANQISPQCGFIGLKGIDSKGLSINIYIKLNIFQVFFIIDSEDREMYDRYNQKLLKVIFRVLKPHI